MIAKFKELLQKCRVRLDAFYVEGQIEGPDAVLAKEIDEYLNNKDPMENDIDFINSNC